MDNFCFSLQSGQTFTIFTKNNFMSSKNRWVVYPDIDITIDDYKTYLKMTELNEKEKYIAELEIDLTKNNDGTPVNEESLLPEVNEIAPTTLSEEISTEEELSEEEKREIFIKELKKSKIKNAFRPIKHDGKITTNQFGTKYHKKRRVKNKQQKKSRKLSRG
jgi:hypothetical protein